MSAPQIDNLKLRPATPDDAATLQAMITALAHGTGDQDKVRSRPDDFLRYGFGADRLFETLLAERDEKAVGLSLFFSTFSTWLGEPGIYVQDLYVVPHERGNGIGRRLLCATAAHGLDSRASHMRLSVEASNETAQAFYRAINMQHRDQEMTYHLGGDQFLALAGEKTCK